MSLQLKPDYFKTTKILFSNDAVRNTITVFCELVDENATYFLYNSKLIKELLNLGPKCSDMEFLAVLFDFADILKETIQPCFPIFALRKLISIAFFINQLIKQENEENKENSENGHKEKVENTKYLGEIYYLLEISTQLFSSTNQKILSAVVSTYSLVFNMLSSRCRDMAFSDDIENFYKIAKYALKIGQAENILNSAANQQFYLFFLNSIYCFPPDNLINDDVHHLFVDIIKAISYSRQASPIDYNYFSLCDYLITFLKPYKNVYPKETKIFVFSFLSILAMRHEPLVHFLFDDQNIKFFVSFIKETLQQLKPISQHEQILDFFNLPKSEIPPNQIIKTHAFETKFTADNIPIPNLNTESDFTFIPRTPKNIDIKKLIRYIIRLCQIIPDKFYELTSKFMLEFFNSGELSLPMHRFLMFWFNSFIKDDPNKAIESLKPTNLHLFFDLVVFHDLYIRDISQSNFNSIYHIMNNISKADDFKINKNLAEILSEILKRFESDCNSSILDIELVQQYLNIFISAEKIDKNILNSVNFDIILSNILLNQRNAYISSENEEYSKLILNSRIVLFNSLKLFIEIDFFKIYLLSSTTFINTLCQLMFELNLIDFIMQFFGIIIDSYDSTNDQLHSIIVFFQLIFDKVEEPGYIEMAHKLLDYIVLHFHKNSAEIISVFLDTKFLRTLVNFVLSTKNKDDLFNLFRIFQDCSSLQENVKEYLMDLNPFLHLAPLIELQIMDNELKDRLWSIACGQECAFLDKIRTIKDASPLSLIFKAMKVNNESLFSFIHFLRKCCEIDLPSALEICSSDFPSYLIELIQDYRKKEEADDILKETFNLLSLLSKNSMKTKDLLCLFQTLTLISGTKRPFFTLDLIKLMQQIFDTKREIPTSFISSSGKSALLKINETTINQPFSDFTIFFEMKFSSLPHNGKVELLRLVTDKDTTFLLWFNKNQLVLTYLNAELSFESNLEGVFECNEWYQIAFVCKSNTFNVFIDSKLVQNVTIPTIIFSNKIAYGYIGRRLQCCLHSFMFLNTALEQRQFQLLYNLPKSSTSFDISEINEFPHLFQSLFKGIISDSAIFIYNALVTQGKTMPNIAVKYPNCPAEFFGQSYVFSSQPKQIIHCIGGVATLYPLFAQLDQPFLPEMLPSLIDLITALLHNCALNQEEFYFSYGLQVISCLIFSSKLDNITVEFLASLSKLYKEIDYRPLLRQMFLILFLDVRLWIYLPPEKQHKIYQTFINLFEESSNDTQKIIVLKLSFRYILNLIRVCYWTRNLGPQTCLLDKPKIDHNSNEIEAVRPENLELVRKDLFKLAELISAVKFTAQDCETLIFYSFDARDTELCVETQALLLKFLIARNTTLINHLNSNFTFDTFFPLITISEERIRINCLHIFMQFCYPDLRHLLQQYTSHQWISGIVQYFNTKNTSTYLADIALTYTFGYFSSFPNEVNKKYVKFSMGETLPDPQIFSSKFFSLLLMAISEMPLKLSKMYVNEINKAIILKRTDLSKNLYWDHPFLLYIVSRAENEFPDDSVKIVLHFLAFTYIEATRRKQLRETDNARCLLHFLSALLNRDVYYLYEQILLAILEHSLLKGKSRESVVLIFAEAIFEYIFIIPDIDTYATFTFNDHQEIDSDNLNENNDQRLNKCSENTMKRIYKTESYKNIHSLKMKCDKSPLNYIYSSRIDPTSGAWIDKKIAVQFCKLFDLYPVLCENDNFIFMLSFTLSNGILNHSLFSTFSPYIKLVIEHIPLNDKMNDFQTKSFINILAGLSKVILFTEPTHEAHSILNENLAQFTPVINEIFKFNHKEAENTTNFVYLAIEKYSNDCEGYMCQLAANISRSATKDFSDFVDNRKTFIRPDEASQIIMRNRQISTQLQRFASGMKNTQTKGLKKYIEMWRSMSSENGPWCPPEMSFTHHWKLDKSLQNNLRRGLMKENYTFSDHSDASFLRDTASHVVPGNSIPEEDSYQNRLKKLRITDFTGDKTVQLLFEAEEIEDNKIRTQPDDIIIKVDTKYVTMRSVNSGSLMLTSEYLIFDSASKYFEIEMDTIVSVFQRRYLLRDTSIEIFTTLHRSFFFDFVDDQRDQIIQNIYKLKPKNIKFIQVQPKSLDSLIEKAEKRWQRGKLSNFDYLMSINYFAGRTYNDLGQYPVFPWVLSNYTSKELNLRDSTVFRDLTKPLGAMTPERLSMLKKRLLTEDDLEYQYLYGSFYTSAAVVIGYMIRVEPFTSLHIELQSGKFDNPDRLFNSIPKAWDSVNHMMMDFRELIPEFYYSPDFLINTNNFDL